MAHALKLLALCALVTGLGAGCAAPSPPVSASKGVLVMHYVQGARTPLGVVYRTASAPLTGGGTHSQTTDPRRTATAQAGRAAARLDHGPTVSPLRGDALASGLAQSLDSARTALGPDAARPVQVRIRVVDRLGLRRSGLNLTRGAAPWRLDFDVAAGRLNAETGQAWLNAMASHELYHLMMIEAGWRANTKAPRASHAALEETAASLFGHCANLAANRPALAEAAPAAAVRLPGMAAAARAPFSNAQLRAAAAALRQGRAPRGLRYALSRSLFMRFANGAGRIAPQSAQAEALLSACRRVGPDPARLPDLMVRLAAR